MICSQFKQPADRKNASVLSALWQSALCRCHTRHLAETSCFSFLSFFFLFLWTMRNYISFVTPFPQTAFGIDAISLRVTRAFWISIYLKEETGRNCNGSLISFCHVAAALALSRFFRGAQNQCPHSVGNSLPNPLVILTSRSSKVIAR